jgi:hypothetical protein
MPRHEFNDEEGGTDDPSNANHACRECDGEKSDTQPKGTKWEQ